MSLFSDLELKYHLISLLNYPSKELRVEKWTRDPERDTSIRASALLVLLDARPMPLAIDKEADASGYID